MSMVVITIILILNFALLLGGYYALYTYLYFSTACKRPKSNKKEKNVVVGMPDTYETLSIQGKPGKIQGYYLEGNTRKLVILVHGWLDDAWSRLDDLAFYQKMGYNVFLPDLRGHGASSGKYLGMGIADGQDLEEWVNYFRSKLGKDTEIILDGVSVGGAAVLQMDASFLNQYVSGIVADSSYENLWQMLTKMIHFYPKFMKRFYMFGIELWCRLLGKFKIKNTSTEACIRNINIPVLLIGGALDKIVPIDTQRKLQTACGGKCTLWIQENASHAKASYIDRVAYEDAMSQFFVSI